MLDYILSWLTPTSLFLFLNLTIGSIAISHRFHKTPPQQHHHHQLARPPSLLQRVTSLDFSHYNSQQPYPKFEHVPLDNPTGIVCALSLDFSHYNSQQPYPESEHVTPDNPTGIVRTPSLLDRVRSFNHSFQQPEHVTEHATVLPNHPTGIVRTPSLLARLNSMEFSTLYTFKQESKDLHPKQDHMVHRSKSDTGHEGSERQPEKVIKKTASERGFEETDGGGGWPRIVVEKTLSFGDDEDIDAKADNFINQFKQQLKLQRLNSLLRYKEMLERN